MEGQRLTVVMMAGLPGAGKSTLALDLRRALGWPVIDKDLFETVLRAAGQGDGSTAIAYDLMFALARDLLVEQRLSIVLDCPAGNPARVEQARQSASASGARFAVVLCLAG